MPFHWYYLRFPFQGGVCYQAAKSFSPSQSMWKAWAHSLAKKWSLVEALLSQPSVTDTSTHIQELIVKIHVGAVRPAWIFVQVAFFVVMLWERSRFLDSICPPGPWTAAQCVSWWLQGLWGEESLLEKKREGPVGPLQTRQVLSFTPTVLQHSTEKGFSFSLSCSFCSSCGGRNVGVKWPLLIMHGSACRPFYIILEQSIY